MSINNDHVHIKTKAPVATAKYYVDNFGARIKQEIPGRGLQVDLHGLQLNITTLIRSGTTSSTTASSTSRSPSTTIRERSRC